MKTTLAEFLRLLPTLQHLARFPSCNRAAICKRDGVEVAAVEAIMQAESGALSLWDEEALAFAAKRLRVKLPAFKPGALKVSAAPAAAVPEKTLERSAKTNAADAAKRPVPLAKAAGSPADPAAAPAAPGASGAPSTCRPHFRLVARYLLDHATATESAACKAASLSQATWSAFKGRTFGLGPIDRAQLAAWLAGQPIPVRRLKEPTAAPAAAGAPTREQFAAEVKAVVARTKFTPRKFTPSATVLPPFESGLVGLLEALFAGKLLGRGFRVQVDVRLCPLT